MKKSSIWKLLFSALTVFAVAVFAGCTDDNDDMGAPYLNVTPAVSYTHLTLPTIRLV